MTTSLDRDAEGAQSIPMLANPSLLLIATGALVGINFPLGKLAGDAGISPILWAMIPSLGVAVILFPALAARRALRAPERKVVRFAIFGGIVSFVIPNVILYAVIPHAGAGYMGLMFAQSPVFTLAFSAVLGLRTPGRLGLAGIAVGLVGAAIVSLTRGTAADAPEPIWIAAGFAVPVALAVGNVYRSMAWPENVSPDVLAFWSHGAALFGFLALLLAVEGTVPAASLAAAPEAALAQALAAAAAFPLFFRLQRIGGAVLLSQIGYVAAAVGLVVATILLGERYGWETWAGALVIAAGIALTVLAQRRS
ncbi:DMT family transporter [Nisaea acidiphila]|uniref:DMT family transporter n=1 Tax=Nisaea acidiphila TaxID=1862145 RepID=A0A9J7AYC4_9PROT|nr:DMT family transporter [Nisaea acidiphila]UUX52070.1 DMT family transporter [Nisaea acidiphila]